MINGVQTRLYPLVHIYSYKCEIICIKLQYYTTET